MAKVTIQEVAREAGVALGTVSNVLNHPDRVRPETIERVRAAMDALGYAPNQSARLLAGGSSAVFGLILPHMTHGFPLQEASGAQSEARRAGYDLIMLNSAGDPEIERANLRYLAGSQVAGILIHPLCAQHVELPASRRAIPMVYQGVIGEGPGCRVAADREKQGALVAEHAARSGAHHIAVFGRSFAPAEVDRARGIIHVAHDATVQFEFIDEGAPDRSRDGFEVGSKLMRRPACERPDFIIGLTDALASGALAAVRAAGLRVPGDVAVAGCDGNPLAWIGDIPLTTVVPSGYEVGRRGVQLLIEQIELEKLAAFSGEPMDQDLSRQELIRPFLLQRASSVAGASLVGGMDFDVGAYLV
ncbi:LacI family transcriptional regulator [Collinsella sp. AGMB00827]|uniref:LacI family transcriptional regulator n=1 Tax=Collinsella ureilytica TaxID=2869515 RepID=A0ABS7MJV4_9ACTN|nr:LacI family DNA-binding transcriptional regulator [Collinsella urealyticum]MBY4797656.1 LacI family transcriptional regulator [Collinsella urealyticum]